MGRVLVQLPGSNTTKLLSETLPKNVLVVDEQLHQLRVHDGTTPGGHVIGDTAGSGVPIGTIIPFAGNSVPQGYLLCDGSAISRTNYASLFAVIGTIYGAGDGSTTFNLPNFINTFMEGGTPGTAHSPGLPNIEGYNGTNMSDSGVPSGAFLSMGRVTGNGGGGGVQNRMNFYANRYNAIYGSSDTVQPKAIEVNIVIKYI